jgi:hypothetical protein
MSVFTNAPIARRTIAPSRQTGSMSHYEAAASGHNLKATFRSLILCPERISALRPRYHQAASKHVVLLYHFALVSRKVRW